jgi:hypothetical protein
LANEQKATASIQESLSDLKNNFSSSNESYTTKEEAKNALEYLQNRFEDFKELPAKEKAIIIALIMAGTGLTAATLAFALPTISGATFGSSVFGATGSFGTYGFLTKLGFDTTAVGFLGVGGMAGVKASVIGGAFALGTSTVGVFKGALNRLKRKP